MNTKIVASTISTIAVILAVFLTYEEIVTPSEGLIIGIIGFLASYNPGSYNCLNY